MDSQHQKITLSMALALLVGAACENSEESKVAAPSAQGSNFLIGNLGGAIFHSIRP